MLCSSPSERALELRAMPAAAAQMETVVLLVAFGAGVTSPQSVLVYGVRRRPAKRVVPAGRG